MLGSVLLGQNHGSPVPRVPFMPNNGLCIVVAFSLESLQTAEIFPTHLNWAVGVTVQLKILPLHSFKLMPTELQKSLMHGWKTACLLRLDGPSQIAVCVRIN